ncbi:hypothetical protein V8G54_004204 [Vigna mungo]|uniref:Uncharacterized protein n=1 Tax=Vigna mungo TaxID=3915 RepID=A0AAQ3PDR4_VIGMU
MQYIGYPTLTGDMVILEYINICKLEYINLCKLEYISICKPYSTHWFYEIKLHLKVHFLKQYLSLLRTYLDEVCSNQLCYPISGLYWTTHKYLVLCSKYLVLDMRGVLEDLTSTRNMGSPTHQNPKQSRNPNEKKKSAKKYCFIHNNRSTSLAGTGVIDLM